MFATLKRLGPTLLFLVVSNDALAQCPGGYPYVSTIPELPRGRGTYVSIGSEIVDVFAEVPEGIPEVDDYSILALRREFVSCFSRALQGLLSDSRSQAESIGLLDTPSVLLLRAQGLARETRISGWGFWRNSETKKLLTNLDTLYSNLDGTVPNSIRSCGAIYDRRNLIVTPWQKIDPSVQLDNDLLVTYLGRESTADERRMRVGSAEEMWKLATEPQMRSMERFPVLSLRTMKEGYHDKSAEVAACEPDLTRVDFEGQGENQIAGMIDTSIDTNHCAFRNPGPPSASSPKFLFENRSVESNFPVEARFHGTIVAGLLAGDPQDDNPTKKGVAPKARISFRPLAILDPDRIKSALEDEFLDGSRVFAMSWGDDDCPVDEIGDRKSCRLGPLTEKVDEFAGFHEDALVIASVSNGELLTMPENGRNVLAVAASGGMGRECVRFLGATGPSVTGQWKPDLLSRGCRVKAPVTGSGCLGDFAPPALSRETGMPVDVDCATSWAAPNLAGTAILLRQFLGEGCFLESGCQTRYGFHSQEMCSPSAAQLKSLLVAAGTLPKGVVPGPSKGWGLPDLGKLVRTHDPIFLVDVANWPDDWSELKYDLTEGAWAGPYKVKLNPNSGDTQVTLAWTEPPYGPGVSVTIPNDLDLMVEAYDHQRLLAEFSGDDEYSINPIERVTIPESLKADRLEIYVRAYTVVANTLITGYQGYALSVVGPLDSPVEKQTARPLRCETQLPLVPTMVPPNLPLKFEHPVPESPCDICMADRYR